MAIIMALDYGLERAGLAICDENEKVAMPLETLYLKKCGTRKAMLDALTDRLRSSGASQMVLGLPLSENGQENTMCAQVRNIVKRLRHRVDIPIYFMPEYLSSYEAGQELRSLGLSARKIAQNLDQQAACVILRSFLNLPPDKRILA